MDTTKGTKYVLDKLDRGWTLCYNRQRNEILFYRVTKDNVGSSHTRAKPCSARLLSSLLAMGHIVPSYQEGASVYFKRKDHETKQGKGKGEEGGL